MSVAGGIYCIRNITNNKRYIGSTCSTQGFIKRWTNHKSSLRYNRHYNIHLQRSWNKYGEENFEFTILEECHDDMLDLREQAWIKYYNSSNNKYGYNQTSGGLRCQHSDESKKKNGKSHLGLKWSEEAKKRVSQLRTGDPRMAYWKGKKQPKAMVEKRSLKLRGIKFSGKPLENIRNASKEKYDKFSSPIYQFSKDGIFLNKFERIGLVLEYLNKNNSSNIYNVIKGERKTAYGFKWRDVSFL